MDPVWLARASSGRSRAIRLPIVRMIGQPPSMVPAVSAALQASSAQQRRCEVRGFACREEQGCHDSNRLLYVVRAMRQRETARHRPLPGAYGPPHANRGAACDTTRRPVHDETCQKAEQGGQRQHAHHAQHPHRLDPIEPTPVHGTCATLSDRCADQPAQQCVARTRREGPPPSDRVPRHCTGQCRPHHEHHLVDGNGDNPGDRVGDRLPQDERSDHIAQGCEHDCGTWPGCTRRHQRPIALAASCKPLVNANASAIPTAMTTAALTDRV